MDKPTTDITVKPTKPTPSPYSTGILPSLKDSLGKPGRSPAITREMLPVIEKLASKGLNDATIAKALSVSTDTLAKAKNEVVNSEVLQALEKGRLASIEYVSDEIHKWAAKSAIAAMYLSKVVLGREDPVWAQTEHKQISGNVTVTVQHRYVDTDGVKPEVAQEPIEAEYKEVVE